MLRRLLNTIVWKLGNLGLCFDVTLEDLHGGIVEITHADLGVPRRVERYDLGPNVGDHEFTQLMAPLKFGTRPWLSRLRHLATHAPWTPADLRTAGVGR